MNPARTAAALLATVFAAGCGGATNPIAVPSVAQTVALVPIEARPATETPVVDELAGVSYVMPSDWKSESERGYTLLSTADRGLRIAILVGRGRRESSMAEATEADVATLVRAIARVGLPQSRSVNGMRVTRIEGTGMVDARLVRWSADRLSIARPVVVVAFAGHQEYEAYQPQIDRFVASLEAP